ncbi:Cytidine deaminase [Chryseobacterium taklimakanense]|uniref:Cytidine deaminase n=1 Tax=Chryseobacterium taklimakanense TaxID=536441 RepID=A0A239X693_9FLAO|nr:cytidine deaminase [Chryseobacterium taklimakanense]SNV41940.1 Cytidine deaminase [Chryseobacterium taklimakanense]
MQQEIKIGYEFFQNVDELNDIEKKLFETAKSAREKAYAPYSNFLVGCALLLDNGEIISGNNQENAAFPSGLCAERATIFWTAANFPKEKILKIFVIGGLKDFTEKSTAIPPCGACRQSISEYEVKQRSDIEIYFASMSGEVYKTHSVRDLLPFSFDASYL